MDLLYGFVKTSNFYDDLNFPQGFNRSGHFTIQEAELLTAIGKRLFQLEHQLAEPKNHTEENFVIMCQTKREAETRIESLWHKYKSVTQGRRLHTLTGCTPGNVGNTFNELEGNY
ncbi:DUF413 domain-containing protein [Pseudoalteromonas sp.]|uniref:DUF413 domain-containing protein n=1 Tax=Pseudoalteromonas sp. TaxID=53249 RepID=UPI00356720A6